jgi:DNA-binding response OmpR family regulator
MVRPTVLVADSSHIVRRIVEMACADADLDVVSVEDGEQAVAALLPHAPAIVMVETGLTGRDGYAVAGFVKQHRELDRVPVLLMAKMSESLDEARVRACGCDEVIVKPLRPAHLVERLRYWLAHRAMPGSALAAAAAPHADEAARSAPTTAAETTEAFFARLDAAFKSLDRSFGSSSEGAVAAGDESASTSGVPTLHELLERLPEDTRKRLTPVEATSAPGPTPVAGEELIDAVVERVLDRFAERPDLVDQLARRILARQSSHGLS